MRGEIKHDVKLTYMLRADSDRCLSWMRVCIALMPVLGDAPTLQRIEFELQEVIIPVETRRWVIRLDDRI